MAVLEAQVLAAGELQRIVMAAVRVVRMGRALEHQRVVEHGAVALLAYRQGA